MELSEYTIKKYAGILNEEDTRSLFEGLERSVDGNKSEATQLCSLPHKTPYDWQKVGYIKLETKKKVLKACLTKNFLFTMEFMLNRSTDRTIDIIRTLLAKIYVKAMETDSKEKFIELLTKFLELKKTNRCLIDGWLEDEVNDITLALKERATTFTLQFPKRTIEDIKAREFVDVIPILTEAFITNPQKRKNGQRNLPKIPQHTTNHNF